MNNEKIIGFKFFDPVKPPIGAIKDGRFLQKERAMFRNLLHRILTKWGQLLLFRVTESIPDGFDYMKSRLSSRCEGQAKRCENSDFV